MRMSVVPALSKHATLRYTEAAMKYTRTNDSPTKVTLTLTLDSDDLAGIKQSTLDRLAKKMKVPGFRPGRVPLGDGDNLRLEI